MDQLHAEYDELQKQIAYLQQIIEDPELCKKVMKDELNEVKEKYGDVRRTQIIQDEHEFNAEDFYPNDPVVITISHMGYIKRTPLSEFREQARGGVGAKGARHRDQDFTESIYPATMHQTMMFFTRKGRCFWLKCYEIPEGARDSKGRAIQNLLNIEPGDSISAVLRLRGRGLEDEEFINSHYIIFATRFGMVKKTILAAYSHVRAKGINALTIREGDEVIDVRLTNGHNELIMANRNGRAVRFNESELRNMGRPSMGIRGMKIDEDGEDECVGMVAVNKPEEETVMVVSENGYGKRSYVEDYRLVHRSTKGVTTLKITERTGKLVAIKSVTDANDLMIINKSGITIRVAVSECRIMSRVTQGVRLINLEKKGDVIASVCKVMGSELEAAVEEESRRQWTKNQDDLANDNKADGENAAPASESEVESPVEGEQPENTEE
jgi:DNA gyrase subunit A